MRTRKISIERVIELHHTGLNNTQIATRLGCTKQYIGAILIANGIRYENIPRKTILANTKTIKDMRRNYRTWTEIADFLGLTPPVFLRNLPKKYRYPKGRPGYKRCARCKVEKKESAFYTHVDPRRKVGHYIDSYCKVCNTQRHRDYMAALRIQK